MLDSSLPQKIQHKSLNCKQFLTNKTEKNTLDKVYKFQLFVTDNEAGINMDSVKYKQKILKVIHILWWGNLFLDNLPTGDNQDQVAQIFA